MSRISRHISVSDLKRTRQRQIDEQKELAEKKLQEEEKIKQLEEISKSLKSDWRRENLREFGEWAPIEKSGPTNSTSTTFGYFVGGSPAVNYETGQQITFTYSGLNGIENYPTSITIDQGFGEVHTTDPPPFGQIGVQGYTAKLNPRYKEAQEKYKAELKEWEAKKDANFQSIKDTLKSFGTSFEELRASKKWVKKLSDGTVVAIVPTGSNPSPMDWTNNVRVIKMKQCSNASGPMTINYNPPSEYQDWVVENAEVQSEVYLEIGQPPEPPMEQEYLMPRRTDYKDVNPLLDLGQEYAERVGADYMMGARVQDPYLTAQVMDGENLLPPELQDILRRSRNEPARPGTTYGQSDKMKILDFLETPEGQKITPQMFDRLMNIYMRSQTNPYGVDYGNIASTNLRGLLQDPNANYSTLRRGQISGFSGFLGKELYLRYATGRDDPYTERDMTPDQKELLRMHVQQLLDNPNSSRDGSAGRTTGPFAPPERIKTDITRYLTPYQRRVYGMNRGDRAYQMNSYVNREHSAFKDTPMVQNDLQTALGNFLAITNRRGKLKSVRDDFDFEYGNVRADAGLPGQIIIKKKSGGAGIAPGQGILGAIPGYIEASGIVVAGGEGSATEPKSAKLARAAVNAQRTFGGGGNPVPINIKFQQIVRESTWDKLKKHRKTD